MKRDIRDLFKRYKRNIRPQAEQVVKRGRARMVWKQGVAEFGGGMFVLMTALHFFRHSAEWRKPGEILWLILSLPLFAFFGGVWGLWMWGFFTKLLDSSDEENATHS